MSLHCTLVHFRRILCYMQHIPVHMHVHLAAKIAVTQMHHLRARMTPGSHAMEANSTPTSHVFTWHPGSAYRLETTVKVSHPALKPPPDNKTPPSQITQRVRHGTTNVNVAGSKGHVHLNRVLWEKQHSKMRVQIPPHNRIEFETMERHTQSGYLITGLSQGMVALFTSTWQELTWHARPPSTNCFIKLHYSW